MFRKATVAAALALGLSSASCLGPNAAHNSVRNWNANLDAHDAVKELVFLGFNIIPVYGVAYFADVVVLNTIAYWTGDAPIEDPGAFPAENFTN